MKSCTNHCFTACLITLHQLSVYIATNTAMVHFTIIYTLVLYVHKPGAFANKE